MLQGGDLVITKSAEPPGSRSFRRRVTRELELLRCSSPAAVLLNAKEVKIGARMVMMQSQLR